MATVGTGEIKYPGWTITSTVTRQFHIDLSRARRRNLDQKSPGPPGWGLMQRASSSLIAEKQEMLTKKPNTKPRKSDTDRQLKLRDTSCLLLNTVMALRMAKYLKCGRVIDLIVVLKPCNPCLLYVYIPTKLHLNLLN